MSAPIRFAESGFAPDFLIRFGIRLLLRKRLRLERNKKRNDVLQQYERFRESLRQSPIAVDTMAANEQHYEIPSDFFLQVLGKRLKYSCCFYPEGSEGLDEAEEIMLSLTCKRAGIQDGMDVLELGCGWGSLTLWMAEHFPNAQITAISNSTSQRDFIMERCRKHGWEHVRVITADMKEFEIEDTFDRVVSVEMFEHMRNYKRLMKNISSWMKPEARLFVHIFCHNHFAYLYETEGSNDWMGKYFFTGGIMPSYDLLLDFQEVLILENRWRVNGKHYRNTAEQWLQNMSLRKETILPVLAGIYGERQADLWFRRWRIFFMACAELWGFRNGSEWLVAHYLFRKKTS